MDRLRYFKQIKEHWKGPFSIAIFLRKWDIPVVDKWIRSNSNVTHLRLLFYVVPSELRYPKTDYSLWFDRKSMRKITEGMFLYPINLLRDIAIMNVVTTHYINLDMDLWPSCAFQKYPRFFVDSTYQNLHRIPRELLDPWKNVFILPAFQLTEWFRNKILRTGNPVCVQWFHDHQEHRNAVRVSHEGGIAAVRQAAALYLCEPHAKSARFLPFQNGT